MARRTGAAVLPAAAAALLAALAFTACGEPGDSGGSADTGRSGGDGAPPAAIEGEPSWLVAQRDFTWTVDGAGALSLSRAWSFVLPDRPSPRDAWRHDGVDVAPSGAADGDGGGGGGELRESGDPAAGERAATAAPGWTIAGSGPALHLRGPLDGPVDTEVHHWLVLSLAATDTAELAASWQQEDGATKQTRAMPVTSDGAVHAYRVRLRSFQGARGASEVGAVRGALRVRFRGAGGRSPRIRLESIALVSDFDREGDALTAPRRLERNGVFRTGIAVRAPGEARTTVRRADGDRLRLALALAGARQPVPVELTLGAATTALRCEPGAGWLEHEIDLAAAAPGAAPDAALPLVVRARGDGGGQAVLLVGGALQLRAEPRGRPHVLLYLTDTLRADHLRAYGYPRPTSPHLEQMAGQGTVFEQAYGTSNWTRPSVTSLLTSLGPLAHGNSVTTRRVPDELTTLAEAFAAHGWITASFVTNFHGGAWSGLDQGVDVHAEPGAYGATERESTLTSDVVHEPLVAFLERNRDVPSFVFVHTLDPHAPYAPEPADLVPIVGAQVLRGARRVAERLDAPQGAATATATGADADADADAQDAAGADAPAAAVHDAAGSAAAPGASSPPPWLLLLLDTFAPADRDGDLGPYPLATLRYDAEILHNDRTLARLDEALVELGLLEDVLLVFTSDHGEAFGEHGHWMHHQALFEEELAVPMIWRWPGRIAAGRRVALPVSLVDVGPTIAALVGLPAPQRWRGRDLSALCGAGEAPREVRADAPADALLFETVTDDGQRAFAARLGAYKLIARLDGGEIVPAHLFDLEHDPLERRDLLGDPAHAAPRRALLALLEHAVAEGPLVDGADARADAMDPELVEWMRAMGYLR